MEFPLTRDTIDRGLERGILTPDPRGGYVLTDTGRELFEAFVRPLLAGREELLIVEDGP